MNSLKTITLLSAALMACLWLTGCSHEMPAVHQQQLVEVDPEQMKYDPKNFMQQQEQHANSIGSTIKKSNEDPMVMAGRE